jgi:hypothetical protein
MCSELDAHGFWKTTAFTRRSGLGGRFDFLIDEENRMILLGCGVPGLYE